MNVLDFFKKHKIAMALVFLCLVALLLGMFAHIFTEGSEALPDNTETTEATGEAVPPETEELNPPPTETFDLSADAPEGSEPEMTD